MINLEFLSMWVLLKALGLQAITYRKTVEVEERAGPDGDLVHSDSQRNWIEDEKLQKR